MPSREADMARFLRLLTQTVISLSVAAASLPRAFPAQSPAVVFNKDVLPILQRNCQTCHRPGEVGPMSFLTYESTRPWARAIKEAVLSKKMPPWFADPRYGEFRNQPSLTESDIKTLAAWADSGALEGDPRDKPEPIQWPAGWRIAPDVIVSMPEPFNVPAKGSGEIKAFVVPNPFKEDTWVNSIEIRPGVPSVVHHVMVQIADKSPNTVPFSWGAPPPTCVPQASEAFQETPDLRALAQVPKSFAILEAVYVPGSPVTNFQFGDSAKLIPGGGDLRIEVHYTPNGKAVSDQTRVGFKLAKETPQRRYVTLAPKSMANPKYRIPAGEPNWETRGELEFARDAELVWLMPHMHLRGKDMTFNLISPYGHRETVLSAKFDFNWQLGYELEPIRLRKGTRMEVIAHHDNSANNPYNPDPTHEVAWGNLTSEEMVLPWFGVIVDKNADPERILAVRQTACTGQAGRPLPAANPTLNLPRLPILQGIPLKR
jgi:mono/diheme cytochrome c family protein